MTKDELDQQLNQFVERAVERMSARMDAIEERLGQRIDQLEPKIDKVDTKIDQVHESLIKTIHREVGDLADTNRALISKFAQLEARVALVEQKLGLA